MYIYLSVRLSICYSVVLCRYVSVLVRPSARVRYLLISICWFVRLSMSVSVCVGPFCRLVCPSVRPSTRLSVSVCLHVLLSVNSSVSVRLSESLSVGSFARLYPCLIVSPIDLVPVSLFVYLSLSFCPC